MSLKGGQIQADHCAAEKKRSRCDDDPNRNDCWQAVCAASAGYVSDLREISGTVFSQRTSCAHWDPDIVRSIERSANQVVGMIRAGVRFIKYQPDALRIERILLEEC